MAKRFLPFLIALALLATAFYLLGAPAGRSQGPAGPDWQTPLTETELEKAASKMDEALLAQLRDAGPEPLTIIVRLGGAADLSGAIRLENDAERATFVYNRLQSYAATSQAELRAYLESARAADQVVSFHPYFIFNGLAVTAPADFLPHLALHRDVERLSLNETYTLNQDDGGGSPSPAVPGSNISQINADDVWTSYGITGTGVVVANVDTGVQFDHPALVANYRGNLGGSFNHSFTWFDATTDGVVAFPYDDNGHGTHTMGTTAGGDGPGPFADDIGVAPGARWIAVKAFTAAGSATAADLHSAYEWLLAPCPAGVLPGNPGCDPAQAPDIINNSWGNNNGASIEFLADVIALRAAGILPVFSAGNNGPNPGTVGAPASYAEAFAVGAVSSGDLVAGFSSRGPSPLTNETKPDVAAPGVAVRSAIPGSGYAEFNGTSMAAPHVSGAAALMLAADPAIDIDTIEQLLLETALDLGPAGPDPDYGHGRIDAFAAVQRVVEAGAIAGIIDADDTGQPIEGAEIQVEGAGLNISRSSAADGRYQADYLLPGSYTVTVRYYGYAEAIRTNVTVLQEETTTVDITLNALPRYVVNGYVYDAITTTIPISGALVSPLDTPLPGVPTDATGWYSLTVAAGDLRLEAAAFSYATGITDTLVLTDTQIDFYLDPLPPILLVDDDEGALRSYSPHVESHYLGALDANGYAYTYWDIEKEGSPTFDTIRQYAAVVWFGGEFGRVKDISDVTQAEALMAYLDLGGRLFYVAQEHTFYYGDDADCDSPRWGGDGPCPFTKYYLGAADWIEDQKGDVLFGVDGNPVGAGLGPYTMTFPPLLADFTDQITGTIAASLAFSVTDDVPIGDINLVAYTLYSPTAQFKTIFMATPLEALAEVDQADVMYSVMEWFGIAGLSEGVTLAPAYQNQLAAPGDSLTYTVRLRNLSPFADSFDLELATMPWPAEIRNGSGSNIIAEIGPVAPQGTVDFLVVVEVPAGSQPGAEVTIELQATSQSGTPHRNSAFLTAQAEQVYYLLDSDQCDSGVHFDWVDATGGTRHQLDDNGAFPEYSSVPLPAPFKFYNVDYQEIWFNDHGTILFGEDNLFADSQPSGTPPIPNPTLLDPNTAIYAAWGSFFWHPASSPADWGVYTDYDPGRNWFIIQYHGYGNLLGEFDEFEVILDLNSNEIYLQYQTVSDAQFANVGIENQFGNIGIAYVIDQVPAANMLHDNLAVKFGIGAPPLNRAVSFSPADQAATGSPNGQLDYIVTVNSTSSVSDSFDLEVAASNWPVSFWDPTFTTPLSSVGPLDPCTGSDIGVRVMLPDDTSYVSDEAVIRARSQTDPLITANATLFSDNAAPAVGFSPDQNGAAQSRQTVTYTVQISNTGNITDVYSLSLSGNSWPAALALPAGQTSELAPGASQLLTLTVEIPASAPAGATDTVTLTANSQNYPGTSASTALTTEALPFSAVAIDETIQTSGGPPGWVTGYFVTVRNSGNITDSFNLEAIGYGWATTLWNSSFTARISETPPLAADETYRVGVRVTIPTSAVAPGQDMVVVRAQANAELNESDFTTLVTQVTPPPAGDISMMPTGQWATVSPGTTITLTIALQNDGSSREIMTRFDGGVWGPDGTFDIATVGANSSLTYEVPFTVPPDALPGQWDKVVVDVMDMATSTPLAQAHLLVFIDTTGHFVPPPDPPGYKLYLPLIRRE